MIFDDNLLFEFESVKKRNWHYNIFHSSGAKILIFLPEILYFSRVFFRIVVHDSPEIMSS